MNHSSIIIDTDKCFEIDPVTRTIKNQSATKISVIQYDHNSERFSFVLPRMIEGHDMMECNRVEVHYINNGKPGLYEVDDLAVCEDDATKIRCSWLLSQNATKEVGALTFLLRFACVAEDGTVEYAWNTAIFKGIAVAEGMNNSEAIVEQYADVLEQWKQELENSSGGGGSGERDMVIITEVDLENMSIRKTSSYTYKDIDEAYALGKQIKLYGRIIDTNGQTIFMDLQTYDPQFQEFCFSTVYGSVSVCVYIRSDDTICFTLSPFVYEENLTKAIGDIEAALDNIITKYGLGGDSV